MRNTAVLILALLFGATALASEEGGESWRSWHADNDISSTASLQRGARNFMNYCLGCHSLKYIRYNRIAQDLDIPESALAANLIFTGARPHDLVLSALSPADGEAWFGRAPPDLSLMARAKGTDYIYQFLKTFYADPSRPTGVNNVALQNAAMPHVLADLQGLQKDPFVLKKELEKGANGEQHEKMLRVFDRFEQLAPGRLTPQEYDEFVRDTVNFLDYVGEPARSQRERLGIWVILFLLVFTGFAWALKQEIWKDVR